MSYDDKTAEGVKLPADVRRPLFHGGGSMCCGLTSTALMVRVGPADHEDALAQPHARPMDFTGRPLKGMVYVDPPGYRTDAAFAKWIHRGIDFVSALSAKESVTKARKPRQKPARR